MIQTVILFGLVIALVAVSSSKGSKSEVDPKKSDGTGESVKGDDPSGSSNS